MADQMIRSRRDWRGSSERTRSARRRHLHDVPVDGLRHPGRAILTVDTFAGTVADESLIIEDSAGRPRIVMGAPIPDRNAAGNPRAGLIINDATGIERFGLGLQESGRLVMGFDAPPGKGDDRNRERIDARRR